MELLLHFFVTSFLTGLIWVIQVVHYPTFYWVSGQEYVSYALFHTNRITMIVAPVMVAELILSLRLLFVKDLSPILMWTLLALTFVVWASTFFLQVPLHGILASQKDIGAIDRLVSTNWIRTVAWSLKATVLGWIVFNLLKDKSEFL